jgi:hypothetical protein
LHYHAKYIVPDGLLVGARVEIIAKLVTIPREASPQRKKVIPNSAVIHYDGAQDKVAADVVVPVERKATGFIGKRETIWHAGDTRVNRSGKPDSTPQSEKFKEAARDLGCDDSEEAFDEALRKVARHKPKEGAKLTNKDTPSEKPRTRQKPR